VPGLPPFTRPPLAVRHSPTQLLLCVHAMPSTFLGVHAPVSMSQYDVLEQAPGL
jgi:hypothetical protein